jgi:hypothetical protein
MKRNHILKSILLAASLGHLQAQVFTFTDGNLVLGFQATAAQGSNENVFVNLGSATTLRDAPNNGALANLNTALTTVYGTDWYTRTDLWFGVIANLNNQPNSGVGSRAPVNGDPSRTFYISQPTSAAGASPLIPAGTYTGGSLGIGGGNLRGLEQVLIPTTDGTGWNFSNTDPLDDGVPLSGSVGILNQSTAQHATAWNNSWTAWNPSPGAGFGVFTGGIQQNFGKGTSQTFVDIQRILSTNTGAAPGGVVGGGTYVTTIAISSTGLVSATKASTTSPYTAWINSFNPPLTNASDRGEGADPDFDGISNLMEFVLNGNPTVPGQSILPTLDASGANFVFSFTRRDDSESPETSQVFQHSPDLLVWTDVTIGAATAGSVNVSENGANPDTITVTIPKGVNTRLFGRLKVVK